LPAIFQSQGLIKVLDTGKVVSLVLMNEELLKKHSDIGQRVMQALFDAYDYYRTHENESNDWFLAEAQLNGGTQEACKLAASLEPNLKAKSRSEMRVTFSAEDLADLQKASDFLKAKLTSPVDIQKMVDNTYAKNVK
jgi:ABC-type nitrate/sulfonate/bicarbonate transport system substrate-binding protein